MEKLRIKQQLVVGFLIILIGSLVLTILTAIGGWYWLQSDGKEKVFPANYYQNQIPSIEEYIKKKEEFLLNMSEKEEFEKVIPMKGIQYQVVDKQGEIRYGTYTKEIITKQNPLLNVINTNIYAENNNSEITTYVPLVDKDGNLQGAVGLHYRLAVSTNSLIDYLPIILFFSAPFIYITILAYMISNRMGKRIGKPLAELSEASKRIQAHDLDFNLEYKANNEIGELVHSFENMRAALANSLSRQWELEEERREYVRAISHDLKTPLTIVQGHAEGLQSGLWKNEELLQRYLQTIERNTNRMAKLLQEFNTVNELESFSFQLFLSEVNLESFFRKKIEEYEYVAKKKEIEWNVMFETDDDRQTFVFDQERISQVMDNIVMNGVRFTPGAGKMLVKVCIQHGALQFHVYDSGSGFQSGDMQKVFQRFYQEDTSRSSSKEHSGLGLYIAKTIVEKHDGKIFAENSSICGGAHVWFQIPSV
ncbi:two-component sensor histidine kinase [Bacillus pseudomycoides]|uniref:histidine kinase n=1 Tax=Bacillus pseudomycoides TaxID=64104 RepID=A0AA91VCK4_9BACI|nr:MULTISPECIES: HAMP domain-containing sensor histidine kinase [Bacillus]PEB47457.1 two-component sensor histidine kinase [Bacillus sp. AFS098217]PED82801.1 two-component sensor histidine kinase [Bacillus pseudomycoides]PEU10357.1 two-component sensor histidine kinase [Bacillus sp. AFS014408]PEU13321.1 two-component sensor histidine kinase [Bacillus sp. AFS019443]PFW62933.1 two-component sensor histidine kinase [Bacillus sp. AFS075034]